MIRFQRWSRKISTKARRHKTKNFIKFALNCFHSNAPQVYSPPLPPQTDIQPIGGSFYPIYGLFYIRAYNGTTKEASIEPIVNKKNKK